MIGRITGTLIEKNPPTICVDVNGIGYEIDVPMSTLYDLPEVGGQVSLHTHLSIREDAHVLFGFAKAAERIAFRTLIKVSGIGPKTALGILSGLSVDDLASAIQNQDIALLTRAPGIGKKTAERMILELRDKFHVGVVSTTAPNTDRSDILNALLALGYNTTEANKAVKKIPADVSISEGIRQALQILSGRQ
ncbi:Holliday junction branch migration protein RuvA [Paenalcaligenes faecalis]|uniref:Holliday junction branch migration protein RuvA n=1 Tax=Paenalcaligenes faecalis TaxID=2980099 RepID=UPI0022B95795|nr:Holliday junction branch migration protein RuvA [Paenalcaligenes faecalis]